MELIKTQSQIINEQTGFARELIDEILNIVVESADHNAAVA